MFKNPHPDHTITVVGYSPDVSAECSCGWSAKTQRRDGAEHSAGQHHAATRGHKVGQFRAVCTLDTPVLYVDLTDAQRDLVEELKRNAYYDRKLDGHAVYVPCRFTTEDRGEYLAHMALHGKKPQRGPKQLKQGSGMWKPTRLKDDGVPWGDHKLTETCDGCGLVAELPNTRAGELWWREHLDHCAERDTERGAA